MSVLYLEKEKKVRINFTLPCKCTVLLCAIPRVDILYFLEAEFKYVANYLITFYYYFLFTKFSKTEVTT